MCKRVRAEAVFLKGNIKVCFVILSTKNISSFLKGIENLLNLKALDTVPRVKEDVEEDGVGYI